MQVNKISINSSFGMPVAKDFHKIWSKPAGMIGLSCEENLARLDKTTPLHFITRPRSFVGQYWLAAPRIGSNARRIAVAEDFFNPTQYDSLSQLEFLLKKEYKRLNVKM